MHEAPLMLAILSGEKVLTVIATEVSTSPIEKQISFSCVNEDELLYEATIPALTNSKQAKAKTILLDFDVLSGMSEVLLMFSAFIAPKKNLSFSVADKENSKVASYEVFTTNVNGAAVKSIKKIA